MRTEPLRVHRQGGKAVGCGNVLPAARPAINNEFPPREAELAQGRRGAALSTGSSEHFGCRPRLVRPLPAKTLEELVLRPCSPPRPGGKKGLAVLLPVRLSGQQPASWGSLEAALTSQSAPVASRGRAGDMRDAVGAGAPAPSKVFLWWPAKSSDAVLLLPSGGWE